MRHILFLTPLLGGALLYSQQTPASYACEAPAGIQVAIIQAGRTGMDPLLARYSGDFWVQRAYIDATASTAGSAMRGGALIVPGRVPDAVVAQFKSRYDAQADDPEAAFLYAYTLVNRDTAKAVEILTFLTKKKPAFPLPWITLAILHGYPGYSDRARQRTYTEGFLARCPSSIEPRVVFMATQLENSETLATYAKALRENIAGKADVRLLSLYRFLWQIETKVTPPAEQVQLRSRIATDLKFLEGLDQNQFRVVPSLLAQGSQLTGDKEAQQKLSAQSPALSQQAYSQARLEWNKANPLPGSLEARNAHYNKLLQFLDGWLGRLPGDAYLLRDRFSTLAQIPGTSEKALAEAGEKVLDAPRVPAIAAASVMLVAQVWAERGIELVRVPSLVKEGLDEAEKLRARMSQVQQSDLYGSEAARKVSEENARWYSNTYAWRTLVIAYSKTGKSAEARHVLGEWRSALDERRKLVEEIRKKRAAGQPADPARPLENVIMASLSSADAQYSESLAQLALGENRKLDALLLYQSTLRKAGGRPESDLNSKARGLWNELGGTEEGWQSWLEAIPPRTQGPRGTATNRAIPDFALTDRGGKTWTLASLKGKTTLINVWATWCGPCRSEAPLLQKLYEQIKDRGDIQVITLNVDEDVSLVEPFLKENKYTFPVMLAKSFVDGFAGPIGIPTTWIADTGGTIRFEVLGFGGDSGQWLDQTLKQFENVSSAGL